jgi:hypothetical protein
MTFSKLNYAIASLLLVGASSLLVSCGVTPTNKPSNEKEVVKFACCTSVGDEHCELEVEPKKRAKKTEKAPAADDYAGCITVSSNGS